MSRTGLMSGAEFRKEGMAPATVALTTRGPAIRVIGHNLDPDTTDATLVELWVHGRSPHTQRAYRFEATRFLDFLAERDKTLRLANLGDFQAWSDLLTGAPATRNRSRAVVKSLFAFGHRLGYLPFDVGSALKLPKLKDTLAERILPESAVHAMVALEPIARNRRLMRLMYYTGARLSEIVTLRWRDLQPRDKDTGQVTLFGKGEKTRVVFLTAAIWGSFSTIRQDHAPHEPVFSSRKGGGQLHPTAVERVIRNAARRAGLEAHVSPHWLRHAHATHALERGAPIHLVQATLGHASVATTGKYLHARPTDSSARYLAL